MRNWKPSKAVRMEFAQKMQEIDAFCKQHNIDKSRSGDSYYFTLNGTDYRVSNHSIEASNAGAINDFGEQVRDLYHPDGRYIDTVYIHASKTRIIEIYTALVNGVKLDGHGNPVDRVIGEH